MLDSKLKYRDPVAFNLMFRTKSIVYSFMAFPCIPFVTMLIQHLVQPSILTSLMTALEIGTFIGLVTAVGSLLGIVAGGLIGDRFKENTLMEGFMFAWCC